MMLTPRECVAKALDLIRDPKHWTKGAYARTAPGLPGHTGRSVSPIDTDAACWCGEGAIAKIAGVDPENEDFESDAFILYEKAMMFVRAATPGKDIICYTNDLLGHEAVVSRFERALATPA